MKVMGLKRELLVVQRIQIVLNQLAMESSLHPLFIMFQNSKALLISLNARMINLFQIKVEIWYQLGLKLAASQLVHNKQRASFRQIQLWEPLMIKMTSVTLTMKKPDVLSLKMMRQLIFKKKRSHKMQDIIGKTVLVMGLATLLTIATDKTHQIYRILNQVYPAVILVLI